MRMWKFLTFVYRLKGANKYALAGLWIQASMLGLLTQRSHQDHLRVLYYGIQSQNKTILFQITFHEEIL